MTGIFTRISMPDISFAMFTDLTLAFLALGILLLKETADEWGTGIRIADSSSWIVRHVYIFVMIAYILLFGVLGGDQFIYFQF